MIGSYQMTESERPPGNQGILIGGKIREHRKARNLTLVELAQTCAISPSFLSQIERDQAAPSIGTLQAIVHAFGLTMAAFFRDADSNQAPQEAQETIAQVVRADRRKIIIYPGMGTRSELLSPDLQRKIQMTWTVLQPGEDSGETPFQHEGEECGLILQGQVETWIGDEHYILQAGDAIYHPSHVPHRSRNVGDDEAIMITASTPPSF